MKLFEVVVKQKSCQTSMIMYTEIMAILKAGKENCVKKTILFVKKAHGNYFKDG